MQLFNYESAGWYQTIKAESDTEARTKLDASKTWILYSTLESPREDMVTVLGDSRPIVRYYGTGEFDCPYCGYPTKANCLNPWCEANPNHTQETLLAQRAKIAAQEAVKAEGERIREARRVAHVDYEVRRIETQNETIQKAKDGGYCVRCALKYPQKWVRHRGECPHTRLR